MAPVIIGVVEEEGRGERARAIELLLELADALLGGIRVDRWLLDGRRLQLLFELVPLLLQLERLLLLLVILLLLLLGEGGAAGAQLVTRRLELLDGGSEALVVPILY